MPMDVRAMTDEEKLVILSAAPIAEELPLLRVLVVASILHLDVLLAHCKFLFCFESSIIETIY